MPPTIRHINEGDNLMPHPTEAVAVRHPLTQQYVALDRAIDYDPQDVLVVSYPWAFATREAAEGATVEDGVVTAVAVPKAKQEQVTRRRITRK